MRQGLAEFFIQEVAVTTFVNGLEELTPVL